MSSFCLATHRILNPAETFWRKAKYEWLRPSDYGSFTKYKKKIKAIFNNIGLEYKIAFSQMIVLSNIVGVLTKNKSFNLPFTIYHLPL